MAYRIAAIGTFIRDTIITLAQQEVPSIGGLYHTCAFLASLARPSTVILPCCRIGTDFYDEVVAALTRFGPQVSFDLVQRVPQPNTRVTLVYRSAETRDESTSPPMPALGHDELTAVKNCDAALVNLITGRDVELPALQWLKAQSPRPLIYLDVHSLALGIAPGGGRFYRAIPQAAGWLQAADILQMNEKEAATLLGREGEQADLTAFSERVVAQGPTICHITLGSRGSLLCYRERGTIQRVFIAPEVRAKAVDIIGCGDAFGAAFLHHYLEHGDVLAAARFANRVAALNTTFWGSLTPELFRSHVQPYLHA
ncbi:MAG: carbohydrate kinase family protein [candidate division KSB1 bacterium]|nr:carbohydrate kinase family protein [candidate division KSB1 bacterium]MDZ7274679.1 carbohydrate kinase family protein [candidate division KSB1 bacterium]MDZ7285504.1 carbohydrate kinase family protein [candidate division KSB1 bacterium]MDZ7298536.1 carbohydrate kinase family protein [candidate division KSB1 bacterium]MDZ7306612.1 carbohydrate kinase family protein [candidate division KSB1 bacterium]